MKSAEEWAENAIKQITQFAMLDANAKRPDGGVHSNDLQAILTNVIGQAQADARAILSKPEPNAELNALAAEIMNEPLSDEIKCGFKFSKPEPRAMRRAEEWTDELFFPGAPCELSEHGDDFVQDWVKSNSHARWENIEIIKRIQADVLASAAPAGWKPFQEELTIGNGAINMDDEQIRKMVDRFLGWRLPKPWNPDNGISYKRPNYAHDPAEHDWPTGTNLFDASQAEQMIRYMLECTAAPTEKDAQYLGRGSHERPR